MNKQQPHVYVIPEDDEDRQIAQGFELHDRVDSRRIQIMPVARGWPRVLDLFVDEYVELLRTNQHAHVVMLIDFDKEFEPRFDVFSEQIPDELRQRVFVIGVIDEPGPLRREMKLTREGIGDALAEDCATGRTTNWDHEQLAHNSAERRRLDQTVKPFLFK